MAHLTNDQIQTLIEDPNVNKDWMGHIHQCGRCMDLYQELLEVHQSLSRLEYEKPSMRFARNIYEMISKRQAVDSKQRKWIRVIQVTIFSSIFFSIFLSLFLMASTPIDEEVIHSSLNPFSEWSIILLISISILVVLYSIDRWFIVKKANQEKQIIRN